MKIQGKVVVVTGAARGIGAAMARRFAAEGAAGLVLSDIDGETAGVLADELAGGGVRALGVRTDITDEDQVHELVRLAEDRLGPIDLMCSNAGGFSTGGIEMPDSEWERLWQLNVLSLVYSARAVLPSMLERGSGHLLNTCSAAGLLSNKSVVYAGTKAAAVSFTEWLAIEYRGAGIGVSALCPKGVLTTPLQAGIDAGAPAALGVLAGGDVISPEQVAESVVQGLADDRFLILPHPEVATSLVDKAKDRDAWVDHMRQTYASVGSASRPAAAVSTRADS